MSFIRKQQSNPESAIVSAFYDRFPYPGDPLKDEPPQGFNWRWSLDNAYSFCSGALPLKLGSTKTLRILDAGCGSGVSTDYLAYQNPDSEILAVDISKGALKIAIERLRRSRGKDQAKIRFKNQSIFDLGGEGEFDYINSVGVLHHLTDPLEGLIALASLLKKGAILHLYLYADGGRWEIKRVQESLKAMGILHDINSLQMARDFFENLPKTNRLRKNYEERWSVECKSQAHFADMYLHPQEITFNIEKLFKLIENANLEFIGFSNPNVWSLERLLKGELLDNGKRMSQRQQMKLIENLDPDISHFEFFLSKRPLQRYEWKTDDQLLTTSGKISRCIWGWPGKVFHDSDLNRIEVNSNCLKLLEVIENEPAMPLGLLPLDWDKSLIASTARDLQKQQLLLLYPL